MQYDTTINDWHTCPHRSDPRQQPLFGYMFLDDTACNLASLNLMRFTTRTGFDVASFKHARVVISA
jgi:ribonucleoside-diphosphate reductase alpha chain